jgi:hypothetical protein
VRCAGGDIVQDLEKDPERARALLGELAMDFEAHLVPHDGGQVVGPRRARRDIVPNETDRDVVGVAIDVTADETPAVGIRRTEPLSWSTQVTKPPLTTTPGP